MEELIKVLNENNLQWGLNGNDAKSGIYVWTPGYKHMDCYKLEKFAMENNVYLLSMNYNRQCGKTCLQFREQNNA